MLNTGVYPNEENASSLSEILQANVQEKYYLSPKACQGILRRASARGKELPEVLRVALVGLTEAGEGGSGVIVQMQTVKLLIHYPAPPRVVSLRSSP